MTCCVHSVWDTDVTGCRSGWPAPDSCVYAQQNLIITLRNLRLVFGFPRRKKGSMKSFHEFHYERERRRNETGFPKWRRVEGRREDGSWNWNFLRRFICGVMLAGDLSIALTDMFSAVMGCLCFIHVRRPGFAPSWMCERSIVVHLVVCGFSFHISLFPTVATGMTGATWCSARDLEKLEWLTQAGRNKVILCIRVMYVRVW